MEIRPVTPEDRPALTRFFAEIPERDRTFFKEDVLDERVVAEWGEPRPRHAFVVAVDAAGAIVAWMALSGGVGWSAHVGELRLVVAPSHRRHGLGRTLARRGLIDAFRLGYSKVVVDIISDEAGAIGMFTDLGFAPEALLISHVRDRAGALRDLIVLAHHADDVSSGLSAVGIDAELTA